MNKTTTKVLALAMAGAMAMSACSSKPAEKPADTTKPGDNTTTPTTPEKTEDKKDDKNAIKDLVISKTATRELETFNILHSQRAEDYENLTNIWDGLCEVTAEGMLKPAVAESWGTEDGGKTWTCKIREGVKWVDMNGNEKGVCDAEDFATGLEWVLNYWKNDSANTSMPNEMIVGAKEYYEYTKALTEEEAYALTAGPDSKFQEMVGCKTPDANTIVYTCDVQRPYFESLFAYSCLYPMDQAMVEELGGPKAVAAMDNTNMWYNGIYTMTSYIQGNEKIFTKNPMYWDTEASVFDTVTIKMVESSDVAFQLYQNDEIDYCDLTESMLKTISGDPNHKFYNYLYPATPSKYSYQFHWNYDKHLDDGSKDVNFNTAIANKAFRLSLRYGLDLKDYYKRTNMLDPLACENNYYTMKGLVQTSDGKDYTDLVKERLGLGEQNGETMVRIDKAKAEEYKKQAIEELTALGVTFPVVFDHYISGASQVALDSANVLKDAFEQSLGADYVTLNIKTYVSSLSKEVRDPKLQSFMNNGWGADFGDPINYMGQEIIDDENAWYACSYSNINDVEETEATKELLAAYRTYTDMVHKAAEINDNMDARYEAFADAEAYMLEEGLVLPCNYGIGWCLSKMNKGTESNAMYGCCNGKWKNIETNKNGYTTEEGTAHQAAKLGK